ncbi:Roadblock/LC7 domain-containing protein [Hydrogenivirga caldilitoris]|uniref:Roadblock/LC7 domain-containing protein n=1 Tax=Hydrogenivirga caldilitoris TaxID=246264 RepID=A0A497XTL2_9AQUI|nr:roadblock/LC7 domain-containing protein [Hydrogenivirga caldilitoris]RLJ70263.1 Roadblock/LC7 domain-containing protein [Hydrogenivirga caldilitoris]
MELDIVQYEIDEEVERKLINALKNFVARTEADLVLLSDDAGRIISFYGKNLDETQAEFLASIISGIFGAAFEMAKMVSKEDLLDAIQYESKKQNVVVKAVGERFLVGVLCPKSVALGTVRLFLKELADELNRIFSSVKPKPSKLLKLSPEAIEDKLNKILGAK